MCCLREPQATRILHKKTFANYFDKGFFVTSAGFEPATNGAEIRHSIQLNYEAVCFLNTENRVQKIEVYYLI